MFSYNFRYIDYNILIITATYQFGLACLQLFAQVQIIEEETPLHIPRDSFSHLAAVPTFHSGKVPRAATTSPLPYEHSDDEAGLQADADDYDDSESDSGPEEDRLLRRSVLGTMFITLSIPLLVSILVLIFKESTMEFETFCCK